MTEIASAAPDGPELVPGWLQRLAAIGWRLLAAIALGVVLLRIAVVLSNVAVSILLAAIVAATFAPFVLSLRNRGWSRIKAAAAVFLGAALVIIATLVIIAIAFIPYIAAAIESLATGLAALQQQLAGMSIPPEVGAAIDRATRGIQAWISAGTSQVASDVGSIATVAILATFLTFFFLMDGDKAWAWATASVNTWRRDAIAEAGDDALQRVGGYLRGTAVIAAFDGIAVGIFLAILGVPLAAPLAVIVFFGRFIPYVGGLVTTVLVVLVALGTVGTTAAIWLLVLISILTFVQGKFLAPVIYHKTVHIHPAIALIALPAGAALGGIVGLFVAIPLVAFVLAVGGALISVLGVEPDSQLAPNALVPFWLDRLGQWSWRLLVSIAMLGVLVAAAIQVPIVVLPLVLGIVLAATLAPLVARFERRGWSRGRASIAATLGATFGVLAIVTLTIVSLAGPVNDMVQQAINGADSTNDAVAGNAGPLVTLVETFGVGVVGTIAALLANLSSLGVVILLAVLLMYYFLRDGDGFWRGFLARVEPGRRSHIEAAGTRAFTVLGGYMIGTGAISLFGAATQFLIMTILGIPLALPLAVLAVFGGFIPYIGSLVTTGLAFLVTVATGSPQDVAIMAIFTIVFNIVQGNFVAPIVYSRVVSLHPAVVLAAIPAGNEIAGIVGMFLVVPFLGVVAAVWRTVLRVLDTGPVGSLDEPVAETAPPDPALSIAPTAPTAPTG
jgi:predicted PurR-regulated permease PerM